MDGGFTGERPLVLAPLDNAPNGTIQPPSHSLTPLQSDEETPSSPKITSSNPPAGGGSDRDSNPFAELFVCQLKIRSLTRKSNSLSIAIDNMEDALFDMRANLIGFYKKKYEAIGAAAQLRKRLRLPPAREREEAFFALGRPSIGGALMPPEASFDSKRQSKNAAGQARLQQIQLSGVQLDVDMEYFSSPSLRGNLPRLSIKEALGNRARSVISLLKSHESTHHGQLGSAHRSSADSSRSSELHESLEEQRESPEPALSRKRSKKRPYSYPHSQREAAVSGMNDSQLWMAQALGTVPSANEGDSGEPVLPEAPSSEDSEPLSAGKHVTIADPSSAPHTPATSESSPVAPLPPLPNSSIAPSKWWSNSLSRVKHDRRISIIRALPSTAAKKNEKSVFPLHPLSRFAQIWNALLMMVVGVMLLLMPVSLGFTEGRNILPAMSVFSTIFYALGIWLNFHIGYIQGDNIYMEPRTIANKYIFRGDFFLDLLIRFPWVFLIGLNTALINVISVFASILLYWHWGACTRNFFDVIDDSVPNQKIAERYTTGFYYSAAETLSAGFGSIPPESVYRRWFGVMNFIISATYVAVLVGNIATFMIRRDCSGQRYDQIIDEVSQYIAYKGFSPSLRSRIIEYYEFKYLGGKYFDEKAILTDLSGPLRRTVCVHNCKHLLLQVPFFKDADNKFLTDLSLVLEETHFLEGDLIMHEGDEAEEMYFIWTGTCAVSVQGMVKLQLGEGAFFGVYSLSKHNFDSVLDRFQDVAETMRKVAEDRLANFGKATATSPPPPPPQDPPPPGQDLVPVRKAHLSKSRLLRNREEEGDVWKSLD
ncbi:hypothetical protein BDK51DRAFT_33976 [Blyttiomyces helicus]|uniref:Cyclic nucleotide-binding domain-containing protein n=1 Tax=Blyttiomyces helicus TaxID=388810 RepID=A0A4P9WDX2_9FUNG|nr:hypothetical protein BDK51DRAFT_33976 [Blyttiomyces helicus]|eukprot:RKO90774.1 hypothetical protein BDK51DRAFT_33976 [Blyttiomyces helicus]